MSAPHLRMPMPTSHVPVSSSPLNPIVSPTSRRSAASQSTSSLASTSSQNIMTGINSSSGKSSKSASNSSSSKKSKPFKRAFKAIFSVPVADTWDFPSPPPAASVQPKKAAVATPGRKLVEHAKRVVKAVRKKLNSSTPADELPKTWAEWNKRYAMYEIDLNDPPKPPAVEEGQQDDPFSQQAYAAPHPIDEPERQAAVARLDLFGKRAALRAASTSSPDAPFSHSRTIAPPAPASSSASSIRSTTTTTTTGGRPGSAAGGASISPSVATQRDVASLENHPAFRSIVSQIRDMFNAKVGLITVIDDEQQLFLATGGMPEGVESLPRSVTFCSHAILADDHDSGLVVLDSQKDWRFANNVPTKVMGARFYAGVPLLAPTFGDPDAPSVAIGTLCVVDDKPRNEFDEQSRLKLRALADQATKEIESWVSSRMTDKLERLETQFRQTLHITQSKTSLASSAPAPIPLARTESVASSIVAAPLARTESNTSSAMQALPSTSSSLDRRSPLTSPPPSISLPPTPPVSTHGHSRNASTVSTTSTQASNLSMNAESVKTNSTSASSEQEEAPVQPTAEKEVMNKKPSKAPIKRSLAALPVVEQSPVPACSVESQKLFDASCRMLARSLGLSLVYIASIDFNKASLPSTAEDAPKDGAHNTLRVLASYGMPTPAPAFDSALHVRALRAVEGGLLYRNPNAGSSGYASGILISIMEARRVGFVVCGYTEDREKVIGEKERILFSRFAEKLEDTCLGMLRNRA